MCVILAFVKAESTQQADIVGNWHLAASKGQVDMAVDDGNLSEALVPKWREKHACQSNLRVRTCLLPLGAGSTGIWTKCFLRGTVAAENRRKWRIVIR
jgi:hypothetical protein